MIITKQDYELAFAEERQIEYPIIDRWERQLGYWVDRSRLEDAAAWLACPVKKNAPNWQHGRLLYALTRRRLSTYRGTPALVDIGTAKGFSALILMWALRDSGLHGRVLSFDVVDPHARVRRNTVAELDGLLTVPEVLRPWPESAGIEFFGHSVDLFLADHVPVAFIDGKHTLEAARADLSEVAPHQRRDDYILFDDVQVPGVDQAAQFAVSLGYDVTYVNLLPYRMYAVAKRVR